MSDFKIVDKKYREDILRALKRRGIPITPEELGKMDVEDIWKVLDIKIIPNRPRLYKLINEEELDKRENNMTEELNKHGL